MSDRATAELLPDSHEPVVWEKFEGLNTKPPRPGIADGECFWLDGWMPIGPSHLRILWGTGSSIFDGVSGTTIPWFGFGNIGDTPYSIVLLSDGSLFAANTSTTMLTQIMASGTILNPSSIFGFSQWGSQYLIFTKDQANGYWLWDGTNLFTAGNVGPEVTLDNAGKNYSSPPTITFQTTGNGTGATFSAQLENDVVGKITVTNPGSGFGLDDFIALNSAGGGSDDQAILTASVNNTTGGIDSVYIIQGGERYTSRASVAITNTGGGTGAVISLGITNGTITSAAIVKRGTGFSQIPTLTIDDPGIPGSGGSAIPGGAGGQLGCTVAFGEITGIAVNYGGTGYVGEPTIKIIGDGVNATAVAELAPGGSISAVKMTNNGSDYTRALAVAQGGNNACNASVELMPFGISGTAAEVFDQRVWVTNGSATAAFPPKNRTIFSDPGSPVGFSNGGGAFASTDSFLRVGYHFLRQTNGFLYLGGDSSLNYISGVKTAASTTAASSIASTTFGNVNVDPQIGSPWPSSVQVFSRNIVFANSIGVFVSYGGAVTKASLQLDGFYTSSSITGPTQNFSSAVATIFGIPVYMLLLPVVDQITKQTVNKLLMWDGKKWFTSQQDRALTYIATQEINSVLTAWGTDGTRIFPLFTKPSTAFTKTSQSKLFSMPAYYATKTAIRLHGVVQSYVVDEPLTITIDTETGQGTGNASRSVVPGLGGVTIENNVGATVTLTNGSSQTVIIGGPGLDVFGPLPIGQAGRMIGFTVSTTASDVAMLSISAAAQVETVNV